MSLPLRNTATKYGLLGRLMHWSSVALLLTLILTADNFAALPEGREKALLVRQHASYGLLFLLLMCMRLGWRCSSLNPLYSYNIRAWQKFSASFLHQLIYFVVISQSLSGIFSLGTAGMALPLFDFYEITVFMDKDAGWQRFFASLHYVLSVLIYPLFAIHISAAIYHQLFGVQDEAADPD